MAEDALVRNGTLDLAAVRDSLDGKSLEVNREVLPDDPMYVYNPDLYFEAGPRALRWIHMALIAAGRTSVSSILDFASGGGRVLRYLRVAFPDARLTACDVYGPGIQFCADTFGARPLPSSMNLDEIDFDGPYDLIWVGSFFTHVGAEDWRQMLAQFESLLSPRGVVVFTAYGREIVEAVRRGGNKLDLKDEHVEQIVRDYDDEGFGFFPDFNPAANRGDALARRSWVCTQLERFPSLELMLYVEHGWLGQDVIACARAKGSG